MDNFNQWFDTFIQEKNIDLSDCFEIEGPSGTNHFSYEVIAELIKISPQHEKKNIKNVLVMIDFRNGDVKHFLKHLAKAIAK
jgi:hypothetical protein